MKYEEFLYIEEDGQHKEVIKLHDLNQALVVDYNQDPDHIQLIDLDTDEVLCRFAYGDGGQLEGHDFTVSPRHNYLIIYEAEYGQSLDDLYATLYCLKNKDVNTPRSPSQYGELRVPDFKSFYHLTFMFSNDADEQEIWLTGQEAGNLKVIDVYMYGDAVPSQSNPEAKLARLYKSETYPMVKLADEIRDRYHHDFYYLTDKSVVNNLDKVQQAEHRAFCGFKMPMAFDKDIFRLSAMAQHEALSLCHSMLAFKPSASDANTLAVALRRLDFEFTLLKKPDDDQFQQLAVTITGVPAPTLLMQSIAHMSDLCAQHGFMYEGFTLSQEPVFNEWQDAVAHSVNLYVFICQQLTDGNLSLASFTSMFHQLHRKHDKSDYDNFFSEQQYQALEDLDVALSQFDDWDIKEDELRRIIADYAGSNGMSAKS